MSGSVAGSRALRHNVGISRSFQTLPVRVSGVDGFALLDLLCASDLSVRDGRMLHTLILHPDGTPAADLFVCADDEEALLLVEGMSFGELQAAADAPELRQCAEYADDELGDDYTFEDLSLTHSALGIDGPYAFELMSEVMGTDVLGLPYASFFAVPGGYCFRAGKTGEYGYLLLLEHSIAERIWQAMLAQLPRFTGAEVTVEDLDLAALENGFFSLRHAPEAALRPWELQLSWRTSRRKSFRGVRDASSLPTHRVVHFISPRLVEPGALVSLDGEQVGSVHTSALSHELEAGVGLALLRKDVAHPGLLLRAGAQDESVPLATCSVPWLQNRSLYVNPRESRYVAREELVCPPLVPESLRALLAALSDEGRP